MIRTISVLIVMLSFLLLRAAAQTDTARVINRASYGIIDTVVVIGNEKTKEFVITREMTLKAGMDATPDLVEFDRGRIYSTGLFTRVDVTVVPVGGRNLLIVDVNERWYIIPLPIFGFREGDPKKPFYGAGLLHNNFRGLNQKLFGSIVLGYNPSLALSFSDPWIDRENDLYFSGAFSFSRIKNKSNIAIANTSNFDELHYEINGVLGKRFNIYENVGVQLGYQIVSVTDARPGATVASNGTDRFLFGGISYSFDSRNLRDYTTQGTFFAVSVAKYGFGESQLSFTRFGADFRRFTPLPLDFTFASRIHGSIVAGGVIPTYARSYFGYGERIRGYYTTVFEGENIFGTSVELRWPLVTPRTIVFSAIPLPQEFAVWRFGISLELFADAGTTWFRGDKVDLNSFASGYGAGVVFLLPYDIVVRTEYARNNLARSQFVLGIRSAF